MTAYLEEKKIRAKGKFVFEQQIKYFSLGYLYGICAICRWCKSSVDLCHIIPHKSGGDYSINNIVPLCPNHHRLLDDGNMSKKDTELITQFIYKIYDIVEHAIYMEEFDPSTKSVHLKAQPALNSLYPQGSPQKVWISNENKDRTYLYKLTEDDVRCIRSQPNCRGLGRKLALQYKVSEHTIRDILNRRTWKHI